jgi:hypothetical protein
MYILVIFRPNFHDPMEFEGIISKLNRYLFLRFLDVHKMQITSARHYSQLLT